MLDESVLVVEDEAMIRLGTASVLKSAGYDVFEAAHADEAIALLEAHPEIRLVITDIEMPGSMDGIKLAHYVRDKWPPIQLIVVSGMAAAPARELPEGSAFLTKPVADELLIRSAATMLVSPGGLVPEGALRP